MFLKNSENLRILHVGCGYSDVLPSWFDDWEQVRLDIDANVKPDVVASMLNMGEIGKFNALYNSHTLEHIYPHEVEIALSEYKRVLCDDGFVMTYVPDLEGISATDEVLFTSAVGDICGSDLIYGYRKYVRGNPYMAHHTGFVSETLKKAFIDAGFEAVNVERASDHNLFAIAFPKKLTKEKATEYEKFFAQPLTEER